MIPVAVHNKTKRGIALATGLIGPSCWWILGYYLVRVQMPTTNKLALPGGVLYGWALLGLIQLWNVECICLQFPFEEVYIVIVFYLDHM